MADGGDELKREQSNLNNDSSKELGLEVTEEDSFLHVQKNSSVKDESSPEIMDVGLDFENRDFFAGGQVPTKNQHGQDSAQDTSTNTDIEIDDNPTVGLQQGSPKIDISHPKNDEQTTPNEETSSSPKSSQKTSKNDASGDRPPRCSPHIKRKRTKTQSAENGLLENEDNGKGEDESLQIQSKEPETLEKTKTAKEGSVSQAKSGHHARIDDHGLESIQSHPDRTEGNGYNKQHVSEGARPGSLQEESDKKGSEEVDFKRFLGEKEWSGVTLEVTAVCGKQGYSASHTKSLTCNAVDLQFLVQCKPTYMRELAKEIGCALKVTSESVQFFLEEAHEGALGDVEQKLVKRLKPVLEKICRRPLHVREKMQERYLSCLAECPPEHLQKGQAALYKRNDRKEEYILVGMQDIIDQTTKDFNEMLKRIKRAPAEMETREIKVVEAEVERFVKLKFAQKLERKFSNRIQFVLGTDILVIEGPSDLILEAENEMQRMIADVKTRKLLYNREYMTLLSKESVQKSLCEAMTEEDVECVMRVQPLDQSMLLYALEDEMHKKAEALISQSIEKHEIPKDNLTDDLLENIKQKHSGTVVYVVNKEQNGTICFLGLPTVIRDIKTLIRQQCVEKAKANLALSEQTHDPKETGGESSERYRETGSHPDSLLSSDTCESSQIDEQILDEKNISSQTSANFAEQEETKVAYQNQVQPLGESAADEVRLSKKPQHSSSIQKNILHRDHLDTEELQQNDMLAEGDTVQNDMLAEGDTVLNEAEKGDCFHISQLQHSDRYSSNLLNEGKFLHLQEGGDTQAPSNSSYKEEQKMWKLPYLTQQLLSHSQIQAFVNASLKKIFPDPCYSWQFVGEERNRHMQIYAPSDAECNEVFEKFESLFFEESCPKEKVKDALKELRALDKCVFVVFGEEDDTTDDCIIASLTEDAERIKCIIDRCHKRKSENMQQDRICLTAKRSESTPPNFSKGKEIQESGTKLDLESKHKVILQVERNLLRFLLEKRPDTVNKFRALRDVEVDFSRDVVVFTGSDMNRVSKEAQRFKELQDDFHTEETSEVELDILCEDDLKTIKENVESTCKDALRIDFDGLDTSEPAYFYSWTSNKNPVRLIITYGDVENTKSDVMVIPCSGDLSPVGTVSWNIIRKGGRKNIMNSISEIKRKKNVAHSAEVLQEFNILSSEQTGNLDIQALIFARIPVWSNEGSFDADGITKMVGSVLSYIKKENLRRIAIPVDVGPNFVFREFGQFLAFSFWSDVVKDLEHIVEVHLCVSSEKKAELLYEVCSSSIRQREEEIIYKTLHYVPNLTKKILHDTERKLIAVLVKQGSLVDEHDKVDVIVNSTNQSLDLKRGRVSELLLKKAGNSVQDECVHRGPVDIGAVVSTRSGNLKCKKIYHGVLFPSWLPLGNFSLQVMKTVMRKCLHEAEKDGFSTIAFPALGTGILGYPWCLVAETMFQVVDEYNSLVPNTTIEKVFFVIHPSDTDAVQAFMFKECARDSRKQLRNTYLQSAVTYLETRIPEHYHLVQIMTETVANVLPEKPEVHVLFKKRNENISDLAHIFQEEPENNCYFLEMYQTDTDKNIFSKAIKLVNDKRFTSVAFHLVEFKEDALDNMKKVILKALHSEDLISSRREGKKPKQNIYLHKFLIIINDEQFDKIKATCTNTSFFQKVPWSHSKSWNMIRRSFGQNILPRVTSETSAVNLAMKAKHAIEEILSRWRTLQKCENAASWYIDEDGKRTKLDRETALRLSWAKENNWKWIDIRDTTRFGVFKYELAGMKVYRKEEEQLKKFADLMYEAGREVPEGIPAKPPSQTFQTTANVQKVSNETKMKTQPKQASTRTFPGKAQRQETPERSGISQDSKVSQSIQDIKKGAETYQQEITDGENIQVFRSLTAELNPSLHHFEEQKLKRILASVEHLQVTSQNAKIYLESNSLSSIEDAEDCLRQCGLIHESSDPTKTSGEMKKFEQQNKPTKEEIPCSAIDYEAFIFFGGKKSWYKAMANQVEWVDGKLVISSLASDDHVSDIRVELQKIKEMVKETIELNDYETEKLDLVVNELRKQFPDDFLICKGEDMRSIFVIGGSYELLNNIKHRTHVLLGRITVSDGRRKNRFRNTDQLNENLKLLESVGNNMANRRRGDQQFGYGRDESPFDRSASGYFGLSQAEFKTKEGIVIKVYCASITRLNVDCIVNAANENLAHGGGVAYAIANAAGYEFEKESREYVQKMGKIPVSSCCVTSAGRLSYKCVIHTVGPRWGDYREKWKCKDDLQEAVEVTFREAVKQGCSSIALPAISSGIFGVPWEVCVEQYYKAVVAYSQSATVCIKEIHFVDKDKRLVDFITSKFKEYFSQGLSEPHFTQSKTSCKSGVTETGSGNVDRDPQGFSRSGRKFKNTSKEDNVGLDYSVQSVTEGVFEYDVGKGIRVKLYIGDIVKADVEAVVCPQDERCRSLGRIAKAIMSAASEVHDESEKYKLSRLVKGDVAVLKAGIAVEWNYVIHAVAPRWSATQHQFDYYLSRTFKRILCEAKSHGIKLLATPLLGFGTQEGFQTVVTENSKLLPMELQDFANSQSGSYSLEVHVICHDKGILSTMEKGFRLCFTEEEALPKKESNDSDTSTTDKSEFLKSISNITAEEAAGTCPICMDNLKEPRKLRNCGHVFCTECIEASFKYKPSCPNCGVIYGKLTGDQPDGRISFFRDYRTHLPGYEKFGCIKITYFFPDGKQGPDHPSPGTPYKGIERSGYLPDNGDGKLVAKLLNVAFSRKLVFTIGRSRTTGQDGVLTWNDIHHKTRTYGGTDRFGYPDPTYIKRVMEELSVKGVTEDSADDPAEYKEYSRAF